MIKPVIRPTLDAISWRWIFYVNLPVGIAGTLLAIRFLPEIKPPNELNSAELARVVSAMKQMRYEEQKERTEVGRKARARIYNQRNP